MKKYYLILAFACAVFGLEGCINKPEKKEGKISYPYFASVHRKKEILDGVKRLHVGMHVNQVRKIMGVPDEINDTFRFIKNGKEIGFSYQYLLQKKEEYGSVIERDEKLIKLMFGNDSKLQKIYDWSESPKTADTIDISKIIINKISVHELRMSNLIVHVQNIANRHLSIERQISFFLQVENGKPVERLYWKGEKVYNHKNEVFNTESKSIYSKVLKEDISLEVNDLPLDKALTIICRMSYLTYKQDGYKIILIIPNNWSEKMNEDDEDIEE